MGELKEIHTLIIGGGPSGLAIGAVLRNGGVSFSIIEKYDKVGHAWHNHYERVHLHTVKQLSSLPFMPYPSDYPRYVSRDLFTAYLDLYSKKFSLIPYFNQPAKSIRYENGYWYTETPDVMYKTKKVVVATGYNHSPHSPKWDGMENFQGKILHSKEYLNGKPFTGKRVLIVGIGNTGGEIAIDLFESGAKVDICVRGPVRIVPREIWGTPMQYSALLFSYLPPKIGDYLSKTILGLILPDYSEYGLITPEYGTISQLKFQEKVPLIDVGTVSLIKQGFINVMPDIVRITKDSVVFKNDREEKYDVILLATGYRSGLDSILSNHPELLNEKGYPKIRGQESSMKGLYFLGFNNHVGGFLRNISIEAKKIGSQIIKEFPN
ncbi:MAG TPA: NAD(P)/FAD-dependent oxidoreductase [Leptospiraceae bacterium]|nr:NAD(P)/FAD-dependent oxidoreductase [Leptospiraceae bacterium]HMW05501.1 NAD(P)/FAD-dependent oxidoreductase [Leptospiraceae bacterium]HMX32472.1 NAD(P)/FAD-dependent oxidoreductase [Leptospiraceae bacterium]HMY31011.1 NAD(P)/FAD-dependent oxidoreductase [Leptospiraceae bacterium]HMZ65045.1 NAD(P)/FAD-dependent oxidoreductase [Leptospiraceae bacterium]